MLPVRETDRPTDRPTCRETEAAAAAAEEETTRSIIPPPLPLPPTPTRAPTGGPSPDRNLRSKPSNVRHAPGPAVHSARGRPVIAARATVRAETLDRPVNLEQKQHGTSAARLRRRRRQLSARTECTREPPPSPPHPPPCSTVLDADSWDSPPRGPPPHAPSGRAQPVHVGAPRHREGSAPRSRRCHDSCSSSGPGARRTCAPHIVHVHSLCEHQDCAQRCDMPTGSSDGANQDARGIVRVEHVISWPPAITLPLAASPFRPIVRSAQVAPGVVVGPWPVERGGGRHVLSCEEGKRGGVAISTLSGSMRRRQRRLERGRREW